MMRRAVAVPVTADVAASANASVFFGFALRDTSGSANNFLIYDNASAASGTIVFAGTLAANGASSISIPGGVSLTKGMYLDVTGAVTGAVWVG